MQILNSVYAILCRDGRTTQDILLELPILISDIGNITGHTFCRVYCVTMDGAKTVAIYSTKYRPVHTNSNNKGRELV